MNSLLESGRICVCWKENDRKPLSTSDLSRLNPFFRFYDQSLRVYPYIDLIPRREREPGVAVHFRGNIYYNEIFRMIVYLAPALERHRFLASKQLQFLNLSLRDPFSLAIYELCILKLDYNSVISV